MGFVEELEELEEDFETIEEVEEKQKQLDEDTKEIQGIVDRIVFSNPENGYCVLNIDRDNAPNTTAVGHISSPQEGSKYKFKGEFEKHSKYGLQFQFDDFEVLLPENETGITRYLESVMYGIGPVRAQQIVNRLGKKTLQKIKENPQILNQFDFIDQEQINQISKDLNENSLQAEFKSSICQKGISAGMASRIWSTYITKANKNAENILSDIEENPYILIDDVDRIGFITADKIARGLGIEKDSPFRLKAAIKHVLKEALNDGHAYLPFKKISEQVKELLDIELETVEIARMVKKMTDDQGKLKREGNDVYLPEYIHAEKQLANQIKILLNAENELENEDFTEIIEREEENLDFNYAPEQRKAIKKAFHNNISIITGGPGTGKTTVINSICNIYESLSRSSSELANIITMEGTIYLASPTGKAAKRMEEQTNREAKTIHRLLRYNPFEGGFLYGYEQPLPGPGLIIIDEFSMCDLELARDLFAAIDKNMHVVLVGDVDQLPSVGAGSVLRDIIDSGEVPVTRLKFNFRQANGSIIAKKANEIASGKFPKLKSQGDFEFEKVQEDDEAAEEIISYVKQLHANNVSPMKFQVLAPMYKSDSGVNNMNEKIKEIVNPASKYKNYSSKFEIGKFRLGDKVMVVKNDYDKMVFNGNLGKIIKVEKNKIFVDIIDTEDPEPVEFGVNEFNLLKLAYATTIHKSQGSEFPIVIMSLTKSHYIMLKRNLLYTGMTRAKDKLILVGNSWAVRKAIKNNKVEKRYSKLVERIRGGLNNEKRH